MVLILCTKEVDLGFCKIWKFTWALSMVAKSPYKINLSKVLQIMICFCGTCRPCHRLSPVNYSIGLTYPKQYFTFRFVRPIKNNLTIWRRCEFLGHLFFYSVISFTTFHCQMYHIDKINQNALNLTKTWTFKANVSLQRND